MKGAGGFGLAILAWSWDRCYGSIGVWNQDPDPQVVRDLDN